MKKTSLILGMASVCLSFLMLTSNSTRVTANSSDELRIGDFKKIESFRFSGPEGGTDSPGSNNLPKKVDLRSRGVVTPVKFQNPFGTCWAFGAISASETSILSEMGKTYAETHLDLSEKHLAWFAANAIDDKYSSQNGEGMQQHTATNNSSVKYDMGGMRFYGSGMFSQGVGPVMEEDYPYQGKNKIIDRRLDADGNIYNYCYSKMDDWSIDSKYRFQRKYKLEDSILLGSILDEDNGQTAYDDRILNAVKEQIYMGRGVSVGYKADQSRPDEEGNSEYMNNEHWCQYTDNTDYANHEVCIIGYDDDYPKENFNKNHQPPENGAFLVKNSWGSSENSFPHNGNSDWGIVENGVHTGYFWLSYYDMTIEDFEIFNYDVNPSFDQPEIIDQYDFASYNGAHTVEAKKECEMVNVFTAQYNQELREVSCVTSTPNTQAYYEVYLIDESKEDLTYSALVASASEKYEYGGYHLKSLPKPIRLTKGQKYSIHVKLVNDDGKNEIIIPILNYNHDSTVYKSNLYCNTVVNKEESLLKYNGEWYDWQEIRNTFNPSAGQGMDADNFPIKGYSKLLDSTDLSQKKIVLEKDTYEYDGFAKKPQVSMDGLTEGKDYVVSYFNNIAAGQAKVVVEGKGLFTGSSSKYFTIVKKTADKPEEQPTKAKVKAPVATKILKLEKGKKQIRVIWRKKSSVKGYQIQYSQKKSMKSSKKIMVKSATSTKKKITKLKAKTNYFVRIRTYKKVNGRYYYSTWSSIKKIRTK